MARTRRRSSSIPGCGLNNASSGLPARTISARSLRATSTGGSSRRAPRRDDRQIPHSTEEVNLKGKSIAGLSGNERAWPGAGRAARPATTCMNANQAATCGGLIGVLNGLSGIGDTATNLTLTIPSRGTWKEPFNNLYVNISRDGLPIRTPISDIVERIAAVAKIAILENGGRMEMRDGKLVYIVNCDF